MDKNTIPVLKDYQLSKENSFKKIDKKLSLYNKSEKSQKNQQ